MSQLNFSLYLADATAAIGLAYDAPCVALVVNPDGTIHESLAFGENPYDLDEGGNSIGLQNAFQALDPFHYSWNRPGALNT